MRNAWQLIGGLSISRGRRHSGGGMERHCANTSSTADQSGCSWHTHTHSSSKSLSPQTVTVMCWPGSALCKFTTANGQADVYSGAQVSARVLLPPSKPFANVTFLLWRRANAVTMTMHSSHSCQSAIRGLCYRDACYWWIIARFMPPTKDAGLWINHETWSESISSL